MKELTRANRQLISEMTKLVREHVEHYYADFTAYDIPALIRWNEDSEVVDGYWFIRDTGTHIFRLHGLTGAEILEKIELYSSYNEKAYYFNFATGELNEIKENWK